MDLSGSPKWHQRPVVWIGAVVVALVAAVWLPAILGGGGRPQEGRPIADFTLEDAYGQPFRLSEAYKENWIILVFYRGFG